MEQKPQSLLDQIPGYREAVEKEKQIRESSFAGVNEMICGIEVLPLSFLHLNILASIKSPFAVGGIPTLAQAKLLLWVISPEYRFARKFQEWIYPLSNWIAGLSMRFFKRKFSRKLIALTAEDLIPTIYQFLDEAFYDGPNESSQNVLFSPSYYSRSALIITELSELLNWDRDSVLSVPIKEIFQYRRTKQDIKHLFNPSDKYRGAWLRSQRQN